MRVIKVIITFNYPGDTFFQYYSVQIGSYE